MAPGTLALATFAAAAAAVHAQSVPQWNHTKCPAFWELQAPHVATDFRLEHIDGYFYELAFHDYTQYPLCPFNPRCITSSKALQKYADGTVFVNDTWNLNCAGAFYPQQLLFNSTEHPGYFLGYVPEAKIPFLPKGIIKNMVFPDTVVDFKAGPKGWVLEMQCMQLGPIITFVGINFYAKTTDDATLKEMEAAARARGLGIYMDHGEGLTRVNHTGCPGEPGVATETLVV